MRSESCKVLHCKTRKADSKLTRLLGPFHFLILSLAVERRSNFNRNRGRSMKSEYLFRSFQRQSEPKLYHPHVFYCPFPKENGLQDRESALHRCPRTEARVYSFRGPPVFRA